MREPRARRMARVCSICSHDAHREIDLQLVHGKSKRRIAADFHLSEAAVWRHFREHLPELLAKAYEAAQVADANVLLSDLAKIRESTLTVLDKAERSNHWEAVLKSVREARENIRILGELQGKIATQGTTNIHLAPEWLELRTVIVRALEPHEDALSDVLRALEGVGNGRGSC
jgi:hypothetical protein